LAAVTGVVTGPRPVDPLGQVSVEVVKHEQKALGLSREVLSSPSGAFHRASADTSGLKRLLAHNHLFAWTLLGLGTHKPR